MESPLYPLIYAVIPVHNRRDFTLRFLAWFTRQTYDNLQIIVVDDGSTDGTTEAIRQLYPQVRILTGDGNLWWAGATNLGVKEALKEKADYVLTINDDSQGSADYVETLARVVAESPMHIVGSRLMNADQPDQVWGLGMEVGGTMRFCFRLLHPGTNWTELSESLPAIVPVDALCGNGTLIPAQAFGAAGLYDERWMPQYHADTDFILRSRNYGYQPWVATEAILYNHIQIPSKLSPWKILFDKRSNYYIPSTWASLWRYGNRGLAPFALAYISLEGILPDKWKRRVHHLIDRFFPR